MEVTESDRQPGDRSQGAVTLDSTGTERVWRAGRLAADADPQAAGGAAGGAHHRAGDDPRRARRGPRRDVPLAATGHRVRPEHPLAVPGRRHAADRRDARDGPLRDGDRRIDLLRRRARLATDHVAVLRHRDRGLHLARPHLDGRRRARGAHRHPVAAVRLARPGDHRADVHGREVRLQHRRGRAGVPRRRARDRVGDHRGDRRQPVRPRRHAASGSCASTSASRTPPSPPRGSRSSSGRSPSPARPACSRCGTRCGCATRARAWACTCRACAACCTPARRRPSRTPGRCSTSDDPDEMRKWNNWRKWVRYDAILLFFGITMLVTIIFTVLAMHAAEVNPEAKKQLLAGERDAALTAMRSAFDETADDPRHAVLHLHLDRRLEGERRAVRRVRPRPVGHDVLLRARREEVQDGPPVRAVPVGRDHLRDPDHQLRPGGRADGDPERPGVHVDVRDGRLLPHVGGGEPDDAAEEDQTAHGRHGAPGAGRHHLPGHALLQR